MKGLLKNQFYGAAAGAAILLGFFIVAGIGLLISGNSSLLNIYVLVSATAFAMNALAGFRKEAASKWSKYELTAPITRKDIAKSRYITHAIWVLAGTLLAALFVGLTVAIHGNFFFYHVIRDPLALFCTGAGIALLMGTIFYPSIYLLGTDKSEIIMIVSLSGAIGITVGVIWILNATYGFDTVSGPEFYLSMAIYMTIAVMSFIFSCFLTTFIYRRKDC